MNKVNVLFLAEELRIGGAESYFYKIENNVDRNKYNFFSMAVDGNQRDKIKDINSFFTYSFNPYNRVKQIMKVCKKNNIKVIHANSLQLAFAASVVKKKLGKKFDIKIIYTKHNVTMLEKISKKLYVKFLNKFIDIINPICNVEKDYLIQNGVLPYKIKTIYNGTTINDFDCKRDFIKKNNVSVGILARLSSEKRHDIFVETAQQVKEQLPEIKFYIGGDGPERENISQMITDRNLSDTVFLLGNVNASEFLSHIDFLMLVSDREVLPMSIIEGMASGCIVIARDVGGVKELVTNETGYLIQSNNSKDYAEKLIELFNHNENEKIAYNARQFAEQNFSLEKMLGEIERTYEKLAK